LWGVAIFSAGPLWCCPESTPHLQSRRPAVRASQLWVGAGSAFLARRCRVRGKGAQSWWNGHGLAGRNRRGLGRPRPVPLRQCPGAARPSRPRPIVVRELAYPATPSKARAPSLSGLKLRLLHQLCPLGVGSKLRSQRTRSGSATGGESGEGA
jgi:hypothetical protein